MDAFKIVAFGLTLAFLTIPLGFIPASIIATLVMIVIGFFQTKSKITEIERGASSQKSFSSAPDQESMSLMFANLMKDVTLNAPNLSQLQSIVSVCPGITEAEQARLRVCITVAQSALFLWYFGRLQKVVGPNFREQFSDALSAALATTPLEVALEDYVPSEEERTLLLSKSTQDIPITKTAAGQHQIRIVDLLLGLLSLRQSAYFEAIASDMPQSLVPFLKSGQLTVSGFVGKHHAEYPYAGPLAAVIGAYLASMLASVHKTLAEAPTVSTS